MLSFRFDLAPGRFVLVEEWTTERAPQYIELVNRERARLEEILSWVPYVATLEDAVGVISKAMAEAAQKKALRFMLFLDGEEFIGPVNIVSLGTGTGELGFWMAKRVAWQGIEFLAIRLVIEVAKEVLGLTSVRYRFRPLPDDDPRLDLNHILMRQLGFEQGPTEYVPGSASAFKSTPTDVDDSFYRVHYALRLEALHNAEDQPQETTGR